MRRLTLGLFVLAFVAGSSAQQPKWYKFSKVFISEHYSADSAIGELEATAVFPNKKVHPIACGGNDGELHMGIAETAIKWSQPDGVPFSALADEDDSKFGIVAEPVNLASTTKSSAQVLSGKAVTFTGYFRLWNEGHDSGRYIPAIPIMFSNCTRSGNSTDLESIFQARHQFGLFRVFRAMEPANSKPCSFR